MIPEKGQQIILNDNPMEILITQLGVAIIVPFAMVASERPSTSPATFPFAKEGTASVF